MSKSEIKSPEEILVSTVNEILDLNKKSVADLRFLPPVVAREAIKEAIKQAVKVTLDEVCVNFGSPDDTNLMANDSTILESEFLELEDPILKKLGV